MPAVERGQEWVRVPGEVAGLASPAPEKGLSGRAGPSLGSDMSPRVEGAVREARRWAREHGRQEQGQWASRVVGRWVA